MIFPEWTISIIYLYSCLLLSLAPPHPPTQPPTCICYRSCNPLPSLSNIASWLLRHNDDVLVLPSPLLEPVSGPHSEPRVPHRSTSSQYGGDVMNCGVSDVISPPRTPLPLHCVRRCFIIWAEGRLRLSLVLYSKLWGSNSVVTWMLSEWVCDVVGTHDTCRRVCE